MKIDLNRLKPFTFNWDQGNTEKNWQKHQVSYKECEEIFFNQPLKVFFDIKHSQKENRFTALGLTNSNRRLIVTFTIRDYQIRMISARDQSKKERKFYEAQK